MTILSNIGIESIFPPRKSWYWCMLLGLYNFLHNKSEVSFNQVITVIMSLQLLIALFIAISIVTIKSQQCMWCTEAINGKGHEEHCFTKCENSRYGSTRNCKKKDRSCVNWATFGDGCDQGGTSGKRRYRSECGIHTCLLSMYSIININININRRENCSKSNASRYQI